MKIKLHPKIILTFITIIIACGVFNLRTTRASSTIYINADGSISPPSAPISTIDNITYTFTDNINDQVVVHRNNIIVDGNGSNLQGSGSGTGFSLTNVNNVTIKNTNIKNFMYGIDLAQAANNIITRNNITNNGACGIRLDHSTNNNITENNVTANLDRSVVLDWYSDNNTMSANCITDTHRGIYMGNCYNNTFISNVINNSQYSLHVWGSELKHFIHTIGTSNLKDGEIIYYLTNRKDLTISPNEYSQVGYLALISCDNITIEKLTLTGNGEGLLLANTNNSRTSDTVIIDSYYGIRLLWSSNNTIIDSNITNSYDDGIEIARHSNNNSIIGNNITNNGYRANSYGLWAEDYSDNNTISGNNVANNKQGVWIGHVSNNTFCHNNFIGNTKHVGASSENINFWDNGFEGNCWSNYTGADIYSGQHQNETGSDGIGDIPHVIDLRNRDNYPLIGAFTSFNATKEHEVQIVSNSTLSDFRFNGTAINFKASGENGTSGFCRISIPTALMNDNYKVFINNTQIPYVLLSWPTNTHSRMYFTYDHSRQEITITPEFPQNAILPLLIVTSSLAIMMYKKKESRNP
jgi:parallel beta-helix repeat protein